MDLVVHTAGPFQGNEKCTVLEAAISTKVSKWQYLLIHIGLNSLIRKYNQEQFNTLYPKWVHVYD